MFEDRCRSWSEQALARLRGAGCRTGGARAAVIELLSCQQCCLTAQEIFDRLRSDGRPVGIASVYRALELLVDTKLVQRLEMGDGVARFEPAFADGSQHHHLVCERCHLVVPFSDEPLEEAIDRLAERLGYSFEHREIVLRGDCASCREAVRA